MTTVTVKCPLCEQRTVLELTDDEYLNVRSGMKIQEACPDRDAFFREALISHMCYDCQSKMFHRPKPGENWGEILGECGCCGCPVYIRDNGVCPQCGTELGDDEPCYEGDDCQCNKCGACDSVSTDCGDHECRCRDCATKKEEKQMKIKFYSKENESVTISAVASVYIVSSSECSCTLVMLDPFDHGGWYEVKNLSKTEAELLRDKFFEEGSVDLLSYAVEECADDEEDEDD